MLGKAVPSINDSLVEEVMPGVQTTPIFGCLELDCVSSCTCNIAEREHAVEAYSGPPFVYSEDFQQIGTITFLFQGPQAQRVGVTVICQCMVNNSLAAVTQKVPYLVFKEQPKPEVQHLSSYINLFISMSG